MCCNRARPRWAGPLPSSGASVARPAVAISSTRPQTTTITSPSLRAHTQRHSTGPAGMLMQPWNPGPIKTGAPYMRFVSPLAAGVAMSGGVGIVRTGAAARSGRRRRDCAGAGWHPLARRPRRRTSVAVAAATDHRIVLDESLSSVMRSDRAARHRRPARRHRPPAGPDGATGPVHRGLPVRRAGRGRAAAGRFDVADSYAPAGGRPVGPAAGHATRPGGRRLDPLQGKTPRARLRQGPRARGHPDRGSRSHDRVG